MIRKLLNQNGPNRPVSLRYVIPSAVSAVRVILAILLLAMTNGQPNGMLFAALIGVPIIMALDAVDGMLARHLNSQTMLGSFIDIAADRLVEFIFLLFFVSAGFVPLWFVVIFYGRIILTDACRMWAFRTERVSAEGIFLPEPLRVLVLSKLSRSGYAALKGIMFSLMLLAMYQGKASLSWLEFGTMLGVLAFSLLRAAPILFTYLPWRKDVENLGDRCKELPNFAARSTRVISLAQLASDVCLAAILTFIALR